MAQLLEPPEADPRGFPLSRSRASLSSDFASIIPGARENQGFPIPSRCPRQSTPQRGATARPIRRRSQARCPSSFILQRTRYNDRLAQLDSLMGLESVITALAVTKKHLRCNLNNAQTHFESKSCSST